MATTQDLFMSIPTCVFHSIHGATEVWILEFGRRLRFQIDRSPLGICCGEKGTCSQVDFVFLGCRCPVDCMYVIALPSAKEYDIAVPKLKEQKDKKMHILLLVAKVEEGVHHPE